MFIYEQTLFTVSGNFRIEATLEIFSYLVGVNFPLFKAAWSDISTLGSYTYLPTYLLNLCLKSTYCQYNGKHYKQLHGTAMGSVSVVVAEIVMQNIEERALSTCRQTIPLWLRYVDDTFTAVHKDEIDAFHNHLNEQNTDIQFTREIEEDGKLPFLDCLVGRNNNELRTTVYRKPTHTDRLLDESSYNPTSHKATTIKTLTRRAQLVCSTPDSLSDENKYLYRVFDKKTTTLTSLDETLTGRPTLQKLTGTPHLSRLQLLYPTSKALLRLSRGSYNLTTFA